MNILKYFLASLLFTVALSSMITKTGDDDRATRLTHGAKIVGTSLVTNAAIGSVFHGIMKSELPGYLKMGSGIGLVGSAVIANIIFLKEALTLGLAKKDN